MSKPTKCIALTAKGTQCKSNALDDNAFCGRHLKSAKQGTAKTAPPVIPFNPLTQGKRGRQS